MSLKLSTLYLLAYNSFQAIGWFISLIIIFYNIFSTSSITGTYASAATLISQYIFIIHLTHTLLIINSTIFCWCKVFCNVLHSWKLYTVPLVVFFLLSFIQLPSNCCWIFCQKSWNNEFQDWCRAERCFLWCNGEEGLILCLPLLMEFMRFYSILWILPLV